MRRLPADICLDRPRRSGWRRAPTNRSPSVEMASLIVAEDFIDVALEFFVAPPPRPSALALDLLAQGFGHRLGDALLPATRQLAGELLGLRILDVEGQGKPRFSFFLLPIILPSSGSNPSP